MPGKHIKHPGTCAQCGGTFFSFSYQHQRFCSRRCKGIALTKPLAERFWERVDTSGECWLWLGRRNNQGYGQFDRRKGQSVLAHRMAWELAHGPIPDGAHVCHDCPGGDNPLCVRHLWLGDRASNMADMARKNRVSHGNNNPRAILTPDTVRLARERHAAGSISIKALAQEYGVNPSTMNLALSGKNWARVT